MGGQVVSASAWRVELAGDEGTAEKVDDVGFAATGSGGGAGVAGDAGAGVAVADDGGGFD